MGAKVGAMGSSDFVLPYRALGVDAFPVTGDDDARDALARMLDENYAVILVAEDAAPALESMLEPYTEQPAPCVLTVPSATQSTGYAGEAIGRLLRLATGIDIWSASGGSGPDQPPADDTQ